MQIATLLFDRFSALDALGPAEIFRSIGWAEVLFVAEKSGQIINDTGELTIKVTHTLADVPRPDVIIIPGGPGARAMLSNRRVLDWLNTAQPTAHWTGAICCGVLVLGAAGLLRGVKATTNWRLQDELKAYGAIYVSENYVKSSKFFSAANSAAGVEMAGIITHMLVDVPFAQAALALAHTVPALA